MVIFRPKESQVLRAVIARLALHRDVSWVQRMNVGAAKDAHGQLIRFGFAGLSDIIGQLKDGRFLAIEVKSPGGKPTPAQEAFLNKVKQANGVALCVHDVQQIPDRFAALDK